MKKLLIILGAIALSTPAFAGDVQEKCTEAMSDLGAADVEEGCSCFADALDDDTQAEYLDLDLSDWDDSASDSLKEAGDSCFPE